jgi:uncharacterized protein
MLRRPHVQPFLRRRGDHLHVSFLQDPSGRAKAFLERLCRLVRRLEGRPRSVVVEALRRQERRVRDARRLAGVSKSLLDLCEFRPPPGASRAPEIRDAVFHARGRRWPPAPGDRNLPYEEAAELLGLTPVEVERLLYADLPAAELLVKAARLDGAALLDRYNLDLARGVLLDATRLTLTARGGWRDLFRAVKLARLMYRIERAGRAYRLELTGPAAPFLQRPQRYGIRFARIIPALVRAPGWSLEAEIVRGEERLPYVLDHKALIRSSPARRGRPRYDSAWERALAADFAARLETERRGWTLHREATPVAVQGEVFLPDFTLRHRDGREALVEIVGFWTPEYLEAKLRKVAAARLDHLILVVYRSLGVGALEAAAVPGTVLRFAERPRMNDVLRVAEEVGRKIEN